MEEHLMLCISLGFDMSAKSPFDAYLLAGKIAEDPILAAKSKARFMVLDAAFRSTPFNSRYEEAMGLSSKAFREVVAELTAEEKRQIRERVFGVVPITRNTEARR